MQMQLSMYLTTQRPGILSGQVNRNVSVHTAKQLRAQKLSVKGTQYVTVETAEQFSQSLFTSLNKGINLVRDSGLDV